MNPLIYVIGALIALCGWFGWQSHTRGVQNDKDAVTISADSATIDRLNGELIVAKQAKVGSDNAVADLQGRLKAAVGQQQETERLAASASARATKAERAAIKARDTLNTEREQAYASDQSANAWRNTALPAAITASLRIEWAQTRAIGLRDDDNAGIGRNPAPPIRSNSLGPDNGASIAPAAYDWTQSIVPSLTNGQLLDATSDALGGYRTCGERLGSIATLQTQAMENGK